MNCLSWPGMLREGTGGVLWLDDGPADAARRTSGLLKNTF